MTNTHRPTRDKILVVVLCIYSIDFSIFDVEQVLFLIFFS